MSTWDRLAPSLRASSPGHTGLGKRGPPVVFGSYKGQMLQNNDQQFCLQKRQHFIQHWEIIVRVFKTTCHELLGQPNYNFTF